MDREYLFSTGTIAHEAKDIVPEWLIKLLIPKAGVGAFYSSTEKRIVLPNRKDGPELAEHEFSHASTRSNYGINDRTKKFLGDSYKKLGEEIDDYYSIPTERLARKQQVDYEMERLGIKKYGEEFTDEHYEKLVAYDEEGKFSPDAHAFIVTTKPEYFKQIFNGIAANESTEADSVKQV